MKKLWIGYDTAGMWLFDEKPSWNEARAEWVIPGKPYRGVEVCDDSLSMLTGLLPVTGGSSVRATYCIVELDVRIVCTGKVQEMVSFKAVWSDEGQEIT